MNKVKFNLRNFNFPTGSSSIYEISIPDRFKFNLRNFYSRQKFDKNRSFVVLFLKLSKMKYFENCKNETAWLEPEYSYSVPLSLSSLYEKFQPSKLTGVEVMASEANCP